METLNIINKTDNSFLNNELIYEQVNLENKISEPVLTKYEKAKIIGISAQQIQTGRKPAIEIPSNLTTPLEIAEYELQKKKTPFIIKRKLPNDKFEYFTIDQLEII
tara:strand:+ start:358 stop:675 length:318 start_codon:yes stop_codon:yes gene_type:complete